MKLLTETSEPGELHRLKVLFDRNGVPTHVGNENTATMFSLLHPVGKYEIYVVFDEQFNDAKILLKDDEYIIKKTIDIESYKEYLRSNNSKTLSLMLRKSILIFTITISFTVGIIWFLITLNQ